MPETDPGQIRPFADVLRELGGGRSHDELSTKLHELIAAVKDTGKAGTLTYQVKVTPENDVAVTVTDTITCKPPVHNRKKNIFYIDRGGNLSRKHPDQLAFPLVEAVPSAQIKEA